MLLLTRKINKQSNIDNIPENLTETPLKIISSELRSNDSDLSLWAFGDNEFASGGLDDSIMSILLGGDKIEGKFIFEVCSLPMLQACNLDVLQEDAENFLEENKATHYNIKGVILSSIPNVLKLLRMANTELEENNKVGRVVWLPSITKEKLKNYILSNRIKTEKLNEKMSNFIEDFKRNNNL